MTIESFGPDDIIYRSFSQLHKVYYIARGSVRILSEEEEGNVLILGVGSCFGDFNLVYGMKSRFVIVSNDDTCLHVLRKADFWRLKDISLIATMSLHKKLNVSYSILRVITIK